MMKFDENPFYPAMLRADEKAKAKGSPMWPLALSLHHNFGLYISAADADHIELSIESGAPVTTVRFGQYRPRRGDPKDGQLMIMSGGKDALIHSGNARYILQRMTNGSEVHSQLHNQKQYAEKAMLRSIENRMESYTYSQHYKLRQHQWSVSTELGRALVEAYHANQMNALSAAVKKELDEIAQTRDKATRQSAQIRAETAEILSGPHWYLMATRKYGVYITVVDGDSLATNVVSNVCDRSNTQLTASVFIEPARRYRTLRTIDPEIKDTIFGELVASKIYRDAHAKKFPERDEPLDPDNLIPNYRGSMLAFKDLKMISWHDGDGASLVFPKR